MNFKKTVLALVAAVTLSSYAYAHFNEDEAPQSYRQSFFALLGMNFGPIVASVKEEIPWDAGKIKAWSEQLDILSNIDIMRGFPAGSETGKTKAKPEIWLELEEFEEGINKMTKSLKDLNLAAQSGDKTAIGEAVQATGKNCKGCHDDYKAEEYLN